MKKRDNSGRFGIVILFTLVVFLTLMVHITIMFILMYLLIRSNIIHISNEMAPHTITVLLLTAAISIPIGFLASICAVKFPLKPIRILILSMNRLAAGDFNTRMHIGAIMQKSPAFVAVAESFNKMAEELESTEMLRSDFINNFSHEFKTPIVSIAGFAKLLKRGNLTKEQQMQYLDAIEEESMRLSYMATNVLNLTKVENQTILTDVREFNVSEQIRSCILLLERKWSEKDLDLQLEFDEHMIYANEELMRQVWINLIDNAVKFTPEGQTVRVHIKEDDSEMSVEIMNTGIEISPENQKKIFNKFYQADESHSKQGNGVGLAIVKRIVELHGGNISVKSQNEVTAFTVTLPKRTA